MSCVGGGFLAVCCVLFVASLFVCKVLLRVVRLLFVFVGCLVFARRVMFVVCCLLFVVCCWLFDVRCTLFVVRQVLFVVCLWCVV